MSDQSQNEEVQPEADSCDQPAEITHDGHLPPEYVPVAEGQTNQPEGTVVEPPAEDSEGANDGDN